VGLRILRALGLIAGCVLAALLSEHEQRQRASENRARA
jgi:hypothetical protein